MKLKYYLRGLGIGILVTTIILMIAFSGHKADISDEEIIARAKALGMVMTEQEKEDAIPKGTEDNLTESTEQKPEKTTEQSQTTEQDKTTERNQTTEQGQTESTDQAKAETQKEITVKAGDSSNTVADKLFQEGLVDDASAFNKYLVDNKVDSSIQPGTFTIPQGATYEEIGGLLTGKK